MISAKHLTQIGALVSLCSTFTEERLQYSHVPVSSSGLNTPALGAVDVLSVSHKTVLQPFRYRMAGLAMALQVLEHVVEGELGGMILPVQ